MEDIKMTSTEILQAKYWNTASTEHNQAPREHQHPQSWATAKLSSLEIINTIGIILKFQNVCGS